MEKSIGPWERIARAYKNRTSRGTRQNRHETRDQVICTLIEHFYRLELGELVKVFVSRWVPLHTTREIKALLSLKREDLEKRIREG